MPTPKPQSRNPKPETRNPKPETRDPKPRTRNPNPETRTPKPGTRNLEPGTRNLQLGTRNPEPGIRTRKPKSEALRKSGVERSWPPEDARLEKLEPFMYPLKFLGIRVPKPGTQDPKPGTRNPEPGTRKPKSETQTNKWPDMASPSSSGLRADSLHLKLETRYPKSEPRKLSSLTLTSPKVELVDFDMSHAPLSIGIQKPRPGSRI